MQHSPTDGCMDKLVRVLEAAKALVDVLGPIPSLILAVIILVALLLVHRWRIKEATATLQRVVDAKDDMIKLLNEQNRELRVTQLASGPIFSKAEAARLVYGDDRLSGTPGAGNGNGVHK